MKIDFEKMDKAHAQLKLAVSKDSLSDLERDGAIQRFEYTVELLWKVSKKVLEANGILAITPKDVIHELASAQWISNPSDFLDFIRMRNEISHSYREDVAKKVFEAAKNFSVECEKLVAILKEKSK